MFWFLVACAVPSFLVSFGATAAMKRLAPSEMFVTSLRAILERHARDFSAKWSGKVKMVLQCVAVPVCLLSLSPEFREMIGGGAAAGRFDVFRDVVLWATVAVTIYSGVEYTVRGFRMLNVAPQEKSPNEHARLS